MTEQNAIFSSETPAAGGANNSGSNASANLPEVASSAEGVVVIEPATPDDSPAALGSDVTEIEAHEISDAAFRIALLENECARLTSSIDAMFIKAHKFCGIVAGLVGEDKRPINLYECELLLRDKITRSAEQIQALELDRIATHREAIAAEHATPLTTRYIVADSYIIIDNRQEAQRAALQIALDSGTTALLASINGAEQVVINPVWEAA